MARCVKYDAVRRKDVCVEKKCIEIKKTPALGCTSRGVIAAVSFWVTHATFKTLTAALKQVFSIASHSQS